MLYHVISYSCSHFLTQNQIPDLPSSHDTLAVNSRDTLRRFAWQIRFTGGRNGIGAKATNVFSTSFEERRGCPISRWVLRLP